MTRTMVSSPGLRRAGMCVAAVVLVGPLCRAQVADVPFPGQYLCNMQTEMQAMNAMLLKPVPGKPMEMGFLAGVDNQGRLTNSGKLVDMQGNMIEVYCLKAGNGHGGPDLGYLYTPAGGMGVWVGACTLVDGRNGFGLSYDKVVRGNNGELKVNMFTGFKWFNYQGDDGTANAKTDYHYDYTVANNRMTITKTTGKWEDVLNPTNGMRIGRRYTTTATDADQPAAAPLEFKNLKFKGQQISFLDTDNSLAVQSVAVALNPTSPPGEFRYSLTAQAVGGSGTEQDPYQGIETIIAPGDMLTIGGVDISNPVASGMAAQLGWILDASNTDDAMASFRYMGQDPLVLLAGTTIDGFQFASDMPTGLVNWGLVSPSAGSFSSVVGPVPEPASSVLLAIGGLGLACLGRRLRRARLRSR